MMWMIAEGALDGLLGILVVLGIALSQVIQPILAAKKKKEEKKRKEAEGIYEDSEPEEVAPGEGPKEPLEAIEEFFTNTLPEAFQPKREPEPEPPPPSPIITIPPPVRSEPTAEKPSTPPALPRRDAQDARQEVISQLDNLKKSIRPDALEIAKKLEVQAPMQVRHKLQADLKREEDEDRVYWTPAQARQAFIAYEIFSPPRSRKPVR